MPGPDDHTKTFEDGVLSSIIGVADHDDDDEPKDEEQEPEDEEPEEAPC